MKLCISRRQTYLCRVCVLKGTDVLEEVIVPESYKKRKEKRGYQGHDCCDVPATTTQDQNTHTQQPINKAARPPHQGLKLANDGRGERARTDQTKTRKPATLQGYYRYCIPSSKYHALPKTWKMYRRALLRELSVLLT
jgi:hypothetical protein